MRVETNIATTSKCSSYRGVRRRSWGRYVSEIRLPGKKTRIWLGSFGTPEMAARAYDSAAFFLKGDSANLNFPELADSLPRPESCSRKDIQVAAAKAAKRACDDKKGSDESESEKRLQWWFEKEMDDIVEEVTKEKEAPHHLRFGTELQLQSQSQWVVDADECLCFPFPFPVPVDEEFEFLSSYHTCLELYSS